LNHISKKKQFRNTSIVFLLHFLPSFEHNSKNFLSRIERERENSSVFDDVTSVGGSSSGKRFGGSGRRSLFKVSRGEQLVLELCLIVWHAHSLT